MKKKKIKLFNSPAFSSHLNKRLIFTLPSGILHFVHVKAQNSLIQKKKKKEK